MPPPHCTLASSSGTGSCWDTRVPAWLGCVVKAGSSQQRGLCCPVPACSHLAPAWQSPAASPGPRSCPCVGFPWLRGAPITLVCFHARLAALQLLPGLDLGYGDKVPAREVLPQRGRSRREVGEPLPGPTVSPLPRALWQGLGAMPGSPGGLRGGRVGSCSARAPWYRKRRRKAEVSCCSSGGLGKILG